MLTDSNVMIYKTVLSLDRMQYNRWYEIASAEVAP